MSGRVLRRRFRPEKSMLARVSPWLLGAFVAANLGVEFQSHRWESELSDAVQVASGRPDLEVHCRRWWDYLGDLRGNDGFVYWGSTTANLSWRVCNGATGWADDPFDDGNRFGLMLLAHELGHLVGHRDESETECVAMWAAPTVAEALGGTASDGRTTAQWYARTINATTRADYRAPGCLTGSRPSSPLLD